MMVRKIRCLMIHPVLVHVAFTLVILLLPAQAMTSDGDRLWFYEGMPIMEHGGTSAPYALVSDGDGGAIIVWAEPHKR